MQFYYASGTGWLSFNVAFILNASWHAMKASVAVLELALSGFSSRIRHVDIAVVAKIPTSPLSTGSLKLL